VYTYRMGPGRSEGPPAGGRGMLTIVALGAASALCVATAAYRRHHTGDPFYDFLVWNLVLAWVPFALALGAYAAARARAGTATAILGVLWLLFFPNAPYLLTDFIHLHESAVTPLWYDALMLASFAWTGLLLGFASLYLMQTIWSRAVSPAVSWLGVVVALGLASFGIYLGRFLRFNSWDALVRPRRIAHVIRTELENPFRHPRLVASLVVLTAALTIGYVIVFSATGIRLELERE
jgi:uncharacterized membrane protein